MTYREQVRALAGRAETAVGALYDLYAADRITEAEFVSLVAAAVSRANAQAASLADLGLSAILTARTGTAVPTLGLTSPADDPARLAMGAKTLLEVMDSTQDPRARVGRLGRSEPRTQAARSYSEGMTRSEHVEGWTRGLSGAACQLCRWWARDGRVWPKDHPLKTHKGCSCTANPVVTERIRPVQR